jgi:hypothetical protein
MSPEKGSVCTAYDRWRWIFSTVNAGMSIALEATPASVYRGCERKMTQEPDPSEVPGLVTEAIWAPPAANVRPGTCR